MHYLDEGRGEPVVMLHGNPTWSFYYRNLVLALSSRYRAIVPDHIGCGLSDKPGDDALRLHAAQPGRRSRSAARRTSALDRDITLVLHDWGGMIGMAYALRASGRIARLVILNTAAFLQARGQAPAAGAAAGPQDAAVRRAGGAGLEPVRPGRGPHGLRRDAWPRRCAKAYSHPTTAGPTASGDSAVRAGHSAAPRDPSFAIARQVHDGLHRLADSRC